MARKIDHIIGHSEPIRRIQFGLENEKLFSSSIFCGPEGIGKKMVAVAFAQESNCKKRPACGACDVCVRADVQPNETYLLVEPAGERVKIEQVRDILDFVSLRSQLVHRFVIIDQAEKMTVQAANALLKSIEEPPEGVHFVLVTSNLSMLLPTIRSRCQVVNFSPLSEKELKTIVPELNPWQALWSFGRVSLAQKIVQSEWLELRKNSINFLHKPTDKSVYDTLYKEFSDSQKAEYIFHTWMTYLRDSITILQKQDIPLYNKDVEGFVARFAEHRNVREGMDAVFLARDDYQGNVDKNLILENLAISLTSGMSNV